jgi:hypothetical protein
MSKEIIILPKNVLLEIRKEGKQVKFYFHENIKSYQPTHKTANSLHFVFKLDRVLKEVRENKIVSIFLADSIQDFFANKTRQGYDSHEISSNRRVTF